jgi:hypothetical protein
MVSVLSGAGKVPALQEPLGVMALSARRFARVDLVRKLVLEAGGSWSAGAPPASERTQSLQP